MNSGSFTSERAILANKARATPFDDSYIPEPNSGCWLWLGSVMKPFGHGRAHNPRTGKPTTAHRVSWERHFGKIPKGMCVLHRCDVPSCVNPAHLFLGTRADNIADMIAKGRDQHSKRKANG